MTVFHIGFPKSGSTFLQREVFARAPVDVVSNESMVIGNWSENYTDWDTPAEYIKAMQATRDPRIIVCLRPQVSWIDSWMRIYVRNSQPVTLSPHQRMQTNFWWDRIYPRLHYNEVIQQYQELFGADNVKVLWFHDLETDTAAFVRQVCAFLGVDEPDWRDVQHRRGNSALAAKLRLHTNRIYRWATRLTCSERTCQRLDRIYERAMKWGMAKTDAMLYRFSPASFLSRGGGTGIHHRAVSRG